MSDPGTAMTISCAFATSMQTPEHIVAAERLGYRRAWCYDSPALYPDVWVVLAMAAERTGTIGLGPGVLVPSLRHPMTNAAAVATLAALAPGRVAVAVGAGFTGRMVLGQRPLRWADVADYIRVLRALLRGESAQWEGATIRMLQPGGYGAGRPLDVPVLVGADGPKGWAVAAELGDGVFSAARPYAGGDRPAWRALLQLGTVLAAGEDAGSDRVLAAAGPALAVVYHGLYERGRRDRLYAVPGGRAWAEATDALPAAERHLAIHEGHLVEPNERDRLAWAAGGSAAVGALTLTGTAPQVRSRLNQLAGAGVSELVYQPAGPDIPGELAAFAAAAGVSPG